MQRKHSHFAWIDLLRAFSALAVVFYHVRVDLWIGYRKIAENPSSYNAFDRACSLLSAPVAFFGTAVMLFFIISGFCVHYPYAGNDKAFFWREYFVRRFMRIYPPYFMIVLICVLGEAVGRGLLGSPMTPLPKIASTLLMVQNYISIPYRQSLQIFSNPALWSLPVEMELYFLYPLFLMLLKRTRWTIALSIPCAVTLVSLGVILIEPRFAQRFQAVHQIGHGIFFWGLWCSGAVLAELSIKDKLRSWSAVGYCGALTLLVLCILSTSRDWFIGVQNILWSIFYCLLVWWGLRHFRKPDLTAKWPFALGLLSASSYSLYLTHFPFFKILGYLWRVNMVRPQTNFLIACGFALTAVLPALIFYKLFEFPFHNLARNLSTLRRPSVSPPLVDVSSKEEVTQIVAP